MMLTQADKKAARSPIASPAATKLKALGMSAAAIKKFKEYAQSGMARKALAVADKAIGGYGVESLYPELPSFYYVNMDDEDPYTTTVCFDGRKLFVGSWGDYVEREIERREDARLSWKHLSDLVDY